MPFACLTSNPLEAFARKVRAARTRLVPPQIGKDGTLQEWTEDYQQLEDKHRHFSHMYGLYPGNVISAKRTPELVDGCKAVLEQRGDGGTGFSRGWKMCLWARLPKELPRLGPGDYSTLSLKVRSKKSPQVKQKRTHVKNENLSAKIKSEPDENKQRTDNGGKIILNSLEKQTSVNSITNQEGFIIRS
jgi:hypothetical protein